jgi:hypothetical protein
MSRARCSCDLEAIRHRQGQFERFAKEIGSEILVADYRNLLTGSAAYT